jgi:transposase
MRKRLEAAMKDTQLYEQLLGLSKPWSVERVEMDLEGGSVTVHVRCARDQVWGDPETNQDRAHVHGWVQREWRHLDTCQLRTRIVAEVPRLKFKSGRVEEASVPWAARFSRVTLLLEAFVISLLQAAANIQRVATLLKLDWHTVHTIMNRAVERGMARRGQETVPRIGLDEKSFGRGHDYASVLTDIGQRRVLDVTRGRSLEDARELLCTLTPKQRQGVRAAVMDMWPGYMSATRELLSGADIVHDKFHVSQYLNDAVDRVRRSEHKQLSAQGDSPLTGTKYRWLRRIPDKRSSEARAFRALYAQAQKTSRAWTLKETFDPFWRYHSRKPALGYFKAWAARAMRSRLKPMQEVAAMLRRHQEGLLNYSKHHITNAAAEGFNSVIQALKATARGFRNFENFRARILFYCGKLDLTPASV